MTQYTLQVTDLPAGRLTVILYSETGGLVIPSFHSLIPNGDCVQAVDISAGEKQVTEMTFSYIEDYTNYAIGFWQTVLSAQCELRLQLFDGTTTTEFFWGPMKPKTWSVDETDLTPGRVRQAGGEVTFISKIVALQSRLITGTGGLFDAWPAGILEPVTFTDLTGAETGYIFPCAALIALMLYDSTNFNSTYDIDDVVYEDTDELDFQWLRYGTATKVKFSSLYYVSSIYYTVGGNHGGWQVDTWAARLKTAWDVLSQMASDFGFIPELYYDSNDSRWKMKLRSASGRVSRGSMLSLPVPLRSRLCQDESGLQSFIINPLYPVDLTNMSAWWVLGGDIVYWYFADPSPNVGNTSPPNADFEMAVDLNYETTPDSPGWMRVLEFDGADYYWLEQDVFWYDYSTDAFNQQASAPRARAYFEKGRFGDSPVGIERTYPGIVGSFLGATQIEVRGTTLDFVAKEVRQNLMKNETTIRWVEL